MFLNTSEVFMGCEILVVYFELLFILSDRYDSDRYLSKNLVKDCSNSFKFQIMQYIISSIFFNYAPKLCVAQTVEPIPVDI